MLKEYHDYRIKFKRCLRKLKPNGKKSKFQSVNEVLNMKPFATENNKAHLESSNDEADHHMQTNIITSTQDVIFKPEREGPMLSTVDDPALASSPRSALEQPKVISRSAITTKHRTADGEMVTF